MSSTLPPDPSVISKHHGPRRLLPDSGLNTDADPLPLETPITPTTAVMLLSNLSCTNLTYLSDTPDIQKQHAKELCNQSNITKV